MFERYVAGTKMLEKIEMKEDPMKVDLERELVERNVRLVKCKLKLAEYCVNAMIIGGVLIACCYCNRDEERVSHQTEDSTRTHQHLRLHKQ